MKSIYFLRVLFIVVVVVGTPMLIWNAWRVHLNSLNVLSPQKQADTFTASKIIALQIDRHDSAGDWELLVGVQGPLQLRTDMLELWHNGTMVYREDEDARDWMLAGWSKQRVMACATALFSEAMWTPKSTDDILPCDKETP